MVGDYGKRLSVAMARRSVDTSALAKQLGVSYQAVKKVLEGKSKALNAENNAAAARFLGFSSDWLATGEGPEELGVAQTLSQYVVETPSITWERVMRGDRLPQQFTMPLPDDALAPELPAGASLLWSTSKTPGPDSVVLVVDGDGAPHVRRFAQGVRGTWRGTAARGFYEFDSARDTVRIIAVAVSATTPLP